MWIASNRSLALHHTASGIAVRVSDKQDLCRISVANCSHFAPSATDTFSKSELFRPLRLFFALATAEPHGHLATAHSTSCPRDPAAVWTSPHQKCIQFATPKTARYARGRPQHEQLGGQEKRNILIAQHDHDDIVLRKILLRPAGEAKALASSMWQRSALSSSMWCRCPFFRRYTPFRGHRSRGLIVIA
jgi:hypothetical protein